MSADRWLCSLAASLTVLTAVGAAGAEPSGPSPVSFKMHRIGSYRSEAHGVADFNGDGRPDVIAGPYLYLAPDFKPLAVRKLDGAVDEQGKGYYDDFANLPLDVDGDGRLDVVSAGWFCQAIVWYRNTADGEGLWPEGGRVQRSNFEAADLVDLDGDGQAREILAHGQETIWCEPGRLPSGETGLIAHVISEKKMEFGGGVGDLNGDGRPDVLRPDAWFEAPADPRTGNWIEHPWALGAANGQATHTPQILVYDVDGDGLNDVITSNAHGPGIFWYQQVRASDRSEWKQHTIDDSWTQPHSLVLVDLDGDGDLDLVSGKRFMAHNGSDPGAFDPLVIYWYQLERRPEASWTRYTITRDQGVAAGLSISAVDMDGDGDPDLVVTGKWGGPVWFENQR